jgi:signal transduction histidine kinase/CheY-like chemotaxis protein/ABC-type amino acid transport substrate-binding protein
MKSPALNWLHTVFFICVFLFPGVSWGVEQTLDAQTSAIFTNTEKKWLAAHPEIRLAPDPKFLPIEFINENGQYIGITADFVALIEKKLGISLNIVRLKNWAEVLEKSKAREVDMWGAATPTPQRLEYMLFTEPFIELPAVILVRKNVEKALTLETLKGMNVAVVSGYGIHDHLVNNYPDLKLDVVPDISTGLKKVSFGMVDALIANIAISTYYIEKDGISNLRIAGETGYFYHWGFASRNDWPELNSILQKGIDLIEESERIAIYRKWVGPKILPSLKMKDVLIPVFIIFGVLTILGILVSNRLLKKQVQKRTGELQSELSRRIEIEKMLTGYNRILEMISSDHSLRETLDSLIRLIERQSKEMLCSVLLLDTSGKKLINGSGPNLPWEYNDTLDGMVISPQAASCSPDTHKDEIIVIKDIANDPSWKDHKKFALTHGIKAYWCNPIHDSEGKVLGTFAIYYKRIKEPTEDDLELIQSAAHIAGIAIKHKGYEEKILSAKDDAEKASQAKSEFLSRMSHELRTPMNAILGFGQLLEYDSKEPLTRSQKTKVSEILKAGNHLLGLINEVLDLSSVESGQLFLSLENVNVNEVMQETLLLIAPLAQQRNIQIENRVLDIPNPIFILADRTKLKQVLLNLISNAVKYNCDNGSVILDCEQGSKKRVQIKISDTGKGISKEQQVYIFKPFNRLDAKNSDIEGTGIGLTITKRLLETMDGSITLESELGQGSGFTIELPEGQKTQPPENFDSSKVKEEPQSSHEQMYTLLYVEDNPANLKLVEQALEIRSDIKLLSAARAQLGIDLARAHQPDLILMDIDMPEMDGIQAMKILQNHEETCNIPIIAVSANAMQSDIENGMKIGFKAYITKPFNIEKLFMEIDRSLKTENSPLLDSSQSTEF